MSHSVRITHTTTSTSTSALILNTGYLKTVPGILKLLQLVIGAVCVGIVSHYMLNYNTTQEIFFLLMTVSFLIGTFCLLLSCLVSLSTGGIISKTIYELIYHTIAFILYLIAAILLLVEVNNNRFGYRAKEPYMAASILGLINAVLYLFSAILAQRSYRGI